VISSSYHSIDAHTLLPQNHWLTILRQLAVHPQLPGSKNKKNRLGGGIKTVDEVLTAMKDQAVSDVQSDQRELLAARVRRAQLGMWDKDVEDRFEPALELFKNVAEEIEPVINDIAKEIHQTWKARECVLLCSPSPFHPT
jgi:hypothetical protein